MRAAALCFFLAVVLGLRAQTAAPNASERHAIAALRRAEGDPLRLRALLVHMPKGAELHMHLAGAVYAETLIAEARADLMCVDRSAGALLPNTGTTRSIPPQPVCPEGSVRAETAFTDQRLYDSLIDSFSMRSFVPSAGVSGHDQFFATFDRFDPTHRSGERHGGEWLDEVASRAAAQNEQYLEIMHTPDLGGAFALAERLHWPASPVTTGAYGQDTTGTSDAELAAMRKALLADSAFAQAVEADRAEFHRVLDERRAMEHCGGPSAAAGCAVQIRFLFQVLRANPPALVFVQTMLAFEVAKRELEQGSGAVVVGLNFVQPEDNRIAVAEYTRQMRMVGYLGAIYPQVGVSLHAGELAEGLVKPVDLRFHIRQAEEMGRAERIGHGVDVAYEDDADGLLREMAKRHVLVEINLTSNDVILNITGREHPLLLYRAAGVPVALSTDDEGVSRIDLTHEYVRAVMEFHLSYLELKTMARASLEHSFLPGRSLWKAPDDFSRQVPDCSRQAVPGQSAESGCARFLGTSPKATEQWELEKRFRVFEESLAETDRSR